MSFIKNDKYSPTLKPMRRKSLHDFFFIHLVTLVTLAVGAAA